VLLDHSSKATARPIWAPASQRRSIKNKKFCESSRKKSASELLWMYGWPAQKI